MKGLLLSIVGLLMMLTSISQQITGIEYFIGQDPGVGQGTFVAATTNAEDLTLQIDLDISGLGEGFNSITFRPVDNQGRYGHSEKRRFYVVAATSVGNSPQISGFEYFIDSDQGAGNGMYIQKANSGDSETLAIPISNLADGFHTIGIRAKDAYNNWSTAEFRRFYIAKTVTITESSQLMGFEYFFDQDPGPGNGAFIAKTTSDNLEEVLSIPIGNLSQGFHVLGIRSKDASNQWSVNSLRRFYVAKSVKLSPSANIQTIEYFFDQDPGIGNGTIVTNSLDGADIAEDIMIDVTGKAIGTHRVYIRVIDKEGKASIYQEAEFEVRAVSTDASLSAITLDAGKLDPVFDANISSFAALLPAGTKTVVVGATPNDTNATVTGTGTVDVSSGSGIANLVVTAEDGQTTRTYTINFTVEKITWDGSVWNNNNVGPTETDDAIIAGAFTGSFSCDNLTINSGATLTVNGTLDIRGDLMVNGEMIVESGSSLLTYEANSITGNVTIKRNTRYADGKYSFVGTPVHQDATITGADLGSWVYAYNETNPYTGEGLLRWEDALSDALVPGKGYAQAGKQELVFTGQPNNGTITYTGTFTNRSEANDGWNLVANPYTAAISYSAFMVDNTNNSGTIYLWDDNGSDQVRGSNSDYITVNASGATNTTPAGGQSRYNGYIGSSQAFFVKLDGQGNDNIVFEEDQRDSGNNGDDHFFRTAETITRARINLTTNNGLFKQTLIAWNEGVNDFTMNRLYDSYIFDAAAPYAIYTFKNDQSLAIQTITSEQKELKLGINLAQSGNYTLELDDQEYHGELFLEDLKTGEIHAMDHGSYTFYSEAGQIFNRFLLKMEIKSILGGLLSHEWKAYAHDEVLHVQTGAVERTVNFRLLSLLGSEIIRFSVERDAQVDTSEIPSGVYILTDGVRSLKVIIK